MLRPMRVLRHLVGMKNTEMTPQRDCVGAFSGAGCRKCEESSQEMVVGLAGHFFLPDEVHCVHELLMKTLFPVGCDFHGEDGDALGSELANEHR